MAKWFSRS